MKIKKKYLIAALLLLCIVGCIAIYLIESNKSRETAFDINSITSYREIPGITDEEISAIEALKSARQSFSYASAPSTEAFTLSDNALSDNVIAGFTAMLCELLSQLFGIPFVLEIHEWDDLKNGIDAGTLDFTGELTPTPERMLYYFMTHPIAARSLGVFTRRSSPEIKAETELNGRRIGFFEGTITAQSIFDIYHTLNFEIVDVQNNTDANEKLESGYIDAYVVDSTDSYNYINYPFSRFQVLFPLVYTPVSMVSANPELEPVISVVSKYISAGGIDKLNGFYREGSYEYAKFDLNRSFTGEEAAFISQLLATGSKIRVALEHDNYPVCFYDERSGEFQGIAVDTLKEITRLIGIEFEVVTDKDTPWSDILEMLRRNDAALVSELLYSREREADFIWADAPYSTAYYALVSRADYPNLEVNQVIRTNVGVVRGTAYEDLFNTWFPGHSYKKTYSTHYDAFDALESGEIDLLLTSESLLSLQINFREKPDFKTNIAFPSPLEESFFGFNRQQVLLRSIISKVQSHVNTNQIESNWKDRVYFYSAREARARFLYMSIISAILLLMIIVVSLLFARNLRTRELYKKAVETANEASKAKSSFLAKMSHEIRTPMNAIVGISQMQLQKPNLPKDYSNALETIHDSGISLLAIINDILDMSKIETGNLLLDPAEYSLPSLINDAVTLNVMRIGSKPIEILIDIDENLPSKMNGDEMRLKEILNNLLSNAIKYTEEGSIKLSVRHFMQGSDLMLRFVVEDTGCGIKPEDRQKLFLEFTRFNTSISRYIEGTGLGLSITKNLVDMMGGTIEVESEYGKGSKFTATVRQEAVECEAIGRELSERIRNFTFSVDKRYHNMQITHYPMPYGKVLIVDDVKSNLFVAEGLMLPYELKIETVSSGYDTLDKINAGNTYDVIFMDHMMPQMDGIETTRKLRETGYEGTIVALTANALVGNDVMFKENGFDDFISKPVDIRYLNAVLNKFVRDKYPEEAAKYKLTVKDAKQNRESKTKRKLFKLFLSDAEEAVTTLRKTMADGDIKLFTTTAHAMKSALANIGEDGISEMASALSEAGKRGDLEYIGANHEAFIKSLEALVTLVRNLGLVELPEDSDTNVNEDTVYLTEQLHVIKKACEDYNDAEVYAALDRLKEKQWKKETAAALEELHDMLFLDSNFEGVADRVQKMNK